MELHRFADLAFHFIQGIAHSDATWEVRDTGCVVDSGIFNADGVAHGTHLIS